MDSAYDHIQEESYPQGQSKKQTGDSSSSAQPSNFNTEVQEAYKAISSSPWAARLGGFWQTAKKQVSLILLTSCYRLSDILARANSTTTQPASNTLPPAKKPPPASQT